MFSFVWTLVGAFVRLFRSQQSLLIENLALRQRLVVFKRHNPRPRLAAVDKLFWVFLHRSWSTWKSALIVVSSDTIVGGIVPASNSIGGSSPGYVSQSAEDRSRKRS